MSVLFGFLAIYYCLKNLYGIMIRYNHYKTDVRVLDLIAKKILPPKTVKESFTCPL